VVQVAVEVGGPHVLVNNAGGWIPESSIRRHHPRRGLNLTAPMLLSQLVLEPMKRLGGGRWAQRRRRGLRRPGHFMTHIAIGEGPDEEYGQQ